MAKAKRNYKAEYRRYHGTPKHRRERSQRNSARRALGLKRGDPRHADHRRPISAGGSNRRSNLRAISAHTNLVKGSRRR